MRTNKASEGRSTKEEMRHERGKKRIGGHTERRQVRVAKTDRVEGTVGAEGEEGNEKRKQTGRQTEKRGQGLKYMLQTKEKDEATTAARPKQ